VTPINNKQISIVTVVKDDFLGFVRTADSIQLQDSLDFEWVVVDGSQTLEISNYIRNSRVSSLNIKYFRQPPEGIYSAMNFGMRKASGQYIWYINAGDFLSTRRAISVVIRESNEADCTLAFPVLHTTANKFIYAVTSPMILRVSSTEIHAVMNHQGVLVPKRLLLELGGFDESLKLAADGKLLDLIALTHKIKICSSFLVVFTHGGASSTSHKQVWAELDTYRTRTLSESQLLIRNFKSQLRSILFVSKNQKYLHRFSTRLLNHRTKKLLKRYKIRKRDLDILFS
jgi:glycosyltransferase involved in cell wall biosynthesis